MSAPAVANIRPAREACRDACRAAPWIEVRDADTGKLISSTRGRYREGDVRRCEHGRIWYCTGNALGYCYDLSGYWRPLHRLLDAGRYRRAERALADAEQTQRAVSTAEQAGRAAARAVSAAEQARRASREARR